jgi:hypothetical protein
MAAGKAAEDLRVSFSDLLAKRVEPNKDRLMSEAESKVGSRLLFGRDGPDDSVPTARPLTEMLAEAARTGERRAG